MRIEEARRSDKHLNPDAQETRGEKSGVKEQSGLHNKTLSQKALGMRVCSCVWEKEKEDFKKWIHPIAVLLP